MAKKTYRTYYLKGLQLMFKDENGKRVEIVFRSGIQIDSTSKFSTSDGKIQKLLENSSGFNRDFYLESVAEEKAAKAEVAPENPAPAKEPEVPMSDIKDIKRFHNLVEMKNYMAEIGIEGVDMNYLQAKTAAAKEGYDFQIQK